MPGYLHTIRRPIDLERQMAHVKENSKRPVDLMIKDIGSGMNYNKSGFKQLLLLLMQGMVGEIVLAHKDRSSRNCFPAKSLDSQSLTGTIATVSRAAAAFFMSHLMFPLLINLPWFDDVFDG